MEVDYRDSVQSLFMRINCRFSEWMCKVKFICLQWSKFVVPVTDGEGRFEEIIKAIFEKINVLSVLVMIIFGSNLITINKSIQNM